MPISIQQLQRLQKLADGVRTNQSWIRNALQSLSARPDDRLYGAVLSFLASSVTPDSPILSRFALPVSTADLGGELSLGHIIGASNMSFCLPSSKLPMHVFTAGFSGSGKSTFALRLAEEVYRAGVRPIRIVDPKAQEYNRLARKYPDFMVLKWNELRFNPLTPPPNVPRNEWHQTVVGHLAQNFNFWLGAEELLLSQLRER